MFIIKNSISLYLNIPQSSELIFKLPNSSGNYVNLHFFKSLIVRCTIFKRSFFIKNNNDVYYQLKQRLHIVLFDAIKLVFNTNLKFDINKDLYIQYSVSFIK